MQTPVIIDGIVAAVLLGFLFAGAHRGLIRTAAGFAVLAVALIGAAVVANTLTPVAGRALRPVIEKRVEARIDEALDEVRPVKPQVGDTESPEDGLTLDGLLSLLGIDADPASSIAEKAEGLIRDEGVDLMTAVIQSVAESILHMVIFIVAFPLLLVGLKLLVRALDLAARLPGVQQANALGGGVIGFIEGALAVFLAVWVLRRLGVSFDTETVEQTILLRFFTAHTPLGILAAAAGGGRG